MFVSIILYASGSRTLVSVRTTWRTWLKTKGPVPSFLKGAWASQFSLVLISESSQSLTLGGEVPLEKETATHSSTLAWKISGSNYHKTVLISHVSKVILKILQAKLQQHMNQEIPDVQVGFRKGQGNRDQIGNIH